MHTLSDPFPTVISISFGGDVIFLCFIIFFLFLIRPLCVSWNTGETHKRAASVWFWWGHNIADGKERSLVTLLSQTSVWYDWEQPGKKTVSVTVSQLSYYVVGIKYNKTCIDDVQPYWLWSCISWSFKVRIQDCQGVDKSEELIICIAGWGWTTSVVIGILANLLGESIGC